MWLGEQAGRLALGLVRVSLGDVFGQHRFGLGYQRELSGGRCSSPRGQARSPRKVGLRSAHLCLQLGAASGAHASSLVRAALTLATSAVVKRL